MSDTPQADMYDAVIADLEGKIAALQLTIDNLKNVRGFAGLPTATVVKPQGQGGAPSFPHDAFFQMTIADAAKKYLAVVKKTASANVLADVLVAGGLKSSSKNVAENIRTILSRHPDFVRINGEFGLAEWYPGRRNLGIPRRDRERQIAIEPESEQMERQDAEVGDEDTVPPSH